METKQTRSKRVKKDDTVYVLSGNSRGQSGKVLRVLGDRVVIQGVNQRKRHVKPTRDAKGGIVTIERSIHASNVKISIDSKPVKLRRQVNKDGSSELVYGQEGKETSYRTLRKPDSKK